MSKGGKLRGMERGFLCKLGSGEETSAIDDVNIGAQAVQPNRMGGQL